MTGHAIPRVRRTSGQVWQTDQLVTEVIADDEPIAHYVADIGSGHGFQLTESPETACGRVVPNSMLVDTEYDDVRCVECLTLRPDAQPYPAEPVVVEYSCPVCPDGGNITHQDGLHCEDCDTCWPDGEYAPGIREYPSHVHPYTGLPTAGGEQTAISSRAGIIDVELPPDPDAPPAMRTLADGEQPSAIGGYMVARGMRVECDHDHPSGWALVVAVADGPSELVDDGRLLSGGDDPGDPTAGQALTHTEATVRLTLACGHVVAAYKSKGLHVVVDPPKPKSTTTMAEADESGDA